MTLPGHSKRHHEVGAQRRRFWGRSPRPVEIRRLRRWSIAVICALVLTACAETEIRHPNVILIMVDTLRADHLGCYGWPRDTSPGLDAFAEDSVLFERARSQAACTFPSVNSLFTSRYGARFLQRFYKKGTMAIPDDTPTVAEILSARGFATAAFSASPIVRATPSSANPDGGFGRGFDLFDEHCFFREADCLNTRVLEWVEDARSPFFLYIHYMEPHDPYRPPATHVRRFARDFDGPDHIRNGDPNPIADRVYGDGDAELSDGDIPHLLDLYDEEIASFDGQFSRLLRRLDQLDILDRSIIIIASDHGEEFMDHGDHVKHCRVLYDTSTRVPLIMRIPGVTGQRVATAVENTDIVPTVLDYAGITVEGMSFQGTSLRWLIEGGDPGDRIVFSDQGRYRSADDGRFKLILDGVTMEPQVFDLETDPVELEGHELLDHPRARDLGVELNKWLIANEGGVGSQAALDAGKETQERLRALGYLQ